MQRLLLRGACAGQKAVSYDLRQCRAGPDPGPRAPLALGMHTTPTSPATVDDAGGSAQRPESFWALLQVPCLLGVVPFCFRHFGLSVAHEVGSPSDGARLVPAGAILTLDRTLTVWFSLFWWLVCSFAWQMLVCNNCTLCNFSAHDYPIALHRSQCWILFSIPSCRKCSLCSPREVGR